MNTTPNNREGYSAVPQNQDETGSKQDLTDQVDAGYNNNGIPPPFPSEPVRSEGLSQALTAADILGMRLPDAETGAVSGKVLRAEVKVEKPHKDEFFRVNPDPAYMGAFGLLELPSFGETYLVSRGEAMDWLVETKENCFFKATICVAVTFHGVPYLWPLKVGDNRWHTSAREIAEMAKSKWVMLQSDRNAGYYLAREASDQSKVPTWPEESFADLILKGFRNRVITNMNHDAIKKLRGEL